MNDKQKQCVDAYRKHKHLGLAAQELGIKWQTVYWNLRQANEPVTGDKSRHGSAKDKFADRSEQLFASIVPNAVNQNELQFQAKCDFVLHGVNIDVKAAAMNNHSNTHGWAFALKKQAGTADFFVCFGYAENRQDVERCFVFPMELVRGMQTLRVGRHISGRPKGKWASYEVSITDLPEFFSYVEAA